MQYDAPNLLATTVYDPAHTVLFIVYKCCLEILHLHATTININNTDELLESKPTTKSFGEFHSITDLFILSIAAFRSPNSVSLLLFKRHNCIILCVAQCRIYGS